MIVHIKGLSGIQRFGTGKCCLYFVDISYRLLIKCTLLLGALFFLNIKMLSKGKEKYKKKNREMSENE